jgi:hypothetical protein
MVLLLLGHALGYAAGKAKVGHNRTKLDTNTPVSEGVLTGTFETDYYHQPPTDPATTVYGNATLDYSFSNGWDVQLASYSIALLGGGVQNQQAITYINLAKTFRLPYNFTLTLGTQNGFALDGPEHVLHNGEFGLISYIPNQYVNLHAGSFWLNKIMSMTTDTYGYTTGLSYEFIPGLLTFTGDYYSGVSSMSGGYVNTWLRVHKLAQIYVGVGVPTTNSGNEFYGAFGFQISNK